MLRNLFVVGFLFFISTASVVFNPIQDLAIYYEAIQTIFASNRECVFLCDASCSLNSYEARVFYDIAPKTSNVSVQSCIDQLSNYYQTRCINSTVNCSFTNVFDAHCTYEIEGRQTNTNSDPCLLLAFNNTYVTSCDNTLLGQVFFYTFCNTTLG